MKVIVVGATGMVGQGVLREALLDARVERVLTLGRRATGQVHPKLRELIHADLFDLSAVESQLSGFDACLYCLGVTSAGMSEADYANITYELTLVIARTLAKVNPALTFCFVSGAGADSSERGRVMWARVKGKTENALRELPFRAVFVFRPGLILPMDGITSRTRSYRILYALMTPFFPLLRRMPKRVTTTRRLGRAIVHVAAEGAPKSVLERADLNELAGPDL